MDALFGVSRLGDERSKSRTVDATFGVEMLGDDIEGNISRAAERRDVIGEAVVTGAGDGLVKYDGVDIRAVQG